MPVPMFPHMAQRQLRAATEEQVDRYVQRAKHWVVEAEKWASYVSVAASALAEYMANDDGLTIFASRVGLWAEIRPEPAPFGSLHED